MIFDDVNDDDFTIPCNLPCLKIQAFVVQSYKTEENAKC